jgi:hypothetical protein
MGTVADGVEQDLKAVEDPQLRTSALAESARALARRLDDHETSATAASLCAKVLLETLDRLRQLAPPKAEKDGVDDLASRRQARVSRRSATKS